MTRPHRYAATFARCAEEQRAAFIPFVVLGDPDFDTSASLLRTLVDNGADAVELGLACSDPTADGPVIQAAHTRALDAGATVARSFDLIASLRAAHPDLPIGLLTYANLVVTVPGFHRRSAEAGVDSVLVADVPLHEGERFSAAALEHDVDPIFIATPDLDDDELERLAQLSRGYTYCVSRAGVTGAGAEVSPPRALFERLQAAGAPPAALGFGLSAPEHVQQAFEAGAAAAISGSAVVHQLASALPDRRRGVENVGAFVQNMRGQRG